MIYIDTIEGGKTPSFLYFRDKNDFGYNIPKVLKEELVLTTSKSVYKFYKSKGIDVRYLSSFLGINDNLGLYEVYSYYFDGKSLSDFDMIKNIFYGLIFQSKWCFCLKIGLTFCWFTVESNKLKVLGKLQYSERISKYSLGKFIKRLRNNIAESEINLNFVKYLMWNEDDLNNGFENYFLQCDFLEDFFSKIEGLKGASCLNVMRLLSKDTQLRYSMNAETFVNCLNDSFSVLGIVEKDGIIYSSKVFYKDYSSCISSIVDYSKCSYGIIIDTEGVSGKDGSLKNGVSKLGGLIYCRYENILLNIETFSCDRLLLNETMQRVIENFRSISRVYNKPINVLVFGNSDSIMLSNSLNKKILKSLKFIDCRKFIFTFINEEDINKSLGGIAKYFSVMTLYPKHNPLCDAKTLFNILAKILSVYNKFII